MEFIGYFKGSTHFIGVILVDIFSLLVDMPTNCIASYYLISVVAPQKFAFIIKKKEQYKNTKRKEN